MPPTPLPAPTACRLLDLEEVRRRVTDYHEQVLRLPEQGPGRYRQRAEAQAPDFYASMDVVIARTIMGEACRTSIPARERRSWIAYLQSFQRADGGYEPILGGHGELHAHGMMVGALGVLGGRQRYPATRLYAPFDAPAKVAGYLETAIDWQAQWNASHKFWGGLHIFSHSARVPAGWMDAVFAWLDAHIDPKTGWFRGDAAPADDVQGLGGGVHIWPIYEHHGRPFPCPGRVIDRILQMQTAEGPFAGHGMASYLNLDALYGLKLMGRQRPGYRSREIAAAVDRFGRWFADHFAEFIESRPTAHATLAATGSAGLLGQLAPDLFPDATAPSPRAPGWTDIFTDTALYRTAEVEATA